ncbi:MAG: hypothetical protein U1E65_27055 [Myxococcota bacterium]
MTIERVVRLCLWGLWSVLAAACASTVGYRSGLPESEIQKLPPEVAESYALFAQRCSRCHTLARPLSAHISDPEHWKHYVARMRRQPGSGISDADASKILVFLQHYTREKLKEEGVEVSVDTATVSKGGTK